MMLLVLILPRHAAAQSKQAGGYPPYQAAFAKAAGKLSVETPPAGPVWIQPQALPEKEACTSCHLGVADNHFLYARLPYRRHGGHDVEDHPPEQFGCTVCHGGAPAGLSFSSAGHAPPADPARRKQWDKYDAYQPLEAQGMVPRKWITGRCVVCHAATQLPRGAEPYQAARHVVAHRRCTACHQFDDNPSEHVHVATDLRGLGSKVGGKWLRAYLRSPHAFRPASAMPAFRMPDDALRELSDYLLSRKNEHIPWKTGPPSADAADRGREFVRRRGCATCHDIPGIDDRGFIEQHKVGPSLARVGEKLNPEWIRVWLADPHALRPKTAMPRFRFARGEADDIAAFLASLRNKGAPTPSEAPAARGNAGRAEEIASKYHCAACHHIDGLSLGPVERTDLRNVGPHVLARVAGGAQTGQPLEGADGLFHRDASSPRELVPDADRDPLLTFLAGQVKLPVAAAFVRPAPPSPHAFVPAGPAAKLVEEKRCLTCHSIRGTGGDIGPDLSFAGSKLKRAWIVKFLQSPEPIRPINRARMPNLGLTEQESQTLADWIERDLKTPEVDAKPPDLDLAFSFVGAAKVKSPYGCITCHQIGAEGGKVGPELTHVGSRLKASWIYHWIENPKRWIPTVRMPVFKEMTGEDRAAITRYLSEQQ